MPDAAEGRPKKEPLLSRREFVGNTVKLAVAGAIIPGAMSQLLPAVAPGALAGSGEGPIVLRDAKTNAKQAVTLSDLNGAPPVIVTAEWNFLPAVVYKVKRSILEASSEFHGYNTGQHAIQHPTEPEHAIMVYDGKCKHLGCTIGFDKSLGGAKASVGKEDYDDDGVNDGRILCPCHQGQYDIYNLALNQPATPPPAPLDVIRFKIGTAELESGSVANAIIGVEKFRQDDYRDADVADSAAFALYEPEAS